MSRLQTPVGEEGPGPQDRGLLPPLQRLPYHCSKQHRRRLRTRSCDVLQSLEPWNVSLTCKLRTSSMAYPPPYMSFARPVQALDLSLLLRNNNPTAIGSAPGRLYDITVDVFQLRGTRSSFAIVSSASCHLRRGLMGRSSAESRPYEYWVTPRTTHKADLVRQAPLSLSSRIQHDPETLAAVKEANHLREPHSSLSSHPSTSFILAGLN